MIRITEKIILEDNRISSALIFSCVFLLISILTMAWLTQHIYKSISYDGYIINHIGIIRGSIQRYSKFHLSECKTICEQLERNIDKEISDMQQFNGNNYLISKQVSERLNTLQGKWELLKSLSQELKTSSNPNKRQEFLTVSELCWEIADSVVLLAEIDSSKKLSKINLYYLILGIIVLVLIFVIRFIYNNVRHELEKEVILDHLTGLGNIKQFNKKLDEEISRAERYKHTFALLLFDIDNFKSINDEFGHITGDKALIEISSLVKRSIRKTDMAYRIGGDEFAIILPEVSANEAFELSEKLRQRVNQNQFFSVQNMSVSLGISEYKQGINKLELINATDQALYKAKKEGKNKTAKEIIKSFPQ